MYVRRGARRRERERESGDVAGSIRTKLYPVIRRVSARGAAQRKISDRANKLNTASEMTAGVLFILARARPLL